MSAILLATGGGCRAFGEAGEMAMELAGRPVSFLAKEPGGSCLAIVNEQEIWRRNAHGSWSQVGKAGIPLQSLTSLQGAVFAGAMNEAAMLRISDGGNAERLAGFDATPGREEWFAGGPPLGVRSLAVTADGAAILAAVHVGGIPRSVDGGASWTPTMPVMFDVHEVCPHPSLPNLVAAACAAGFYLSHDGGATWNALSESGYATTSLAVGVAGDEALFSIQDGPFASRSQIWRWRSGADGVEQVRDGLPEWLDGKVDTGHIAAGDGRVALVDGGGNLWLSRAGSSGWEKIALGLGYVFGVAMVEG
jgi:hypothetical protein